MASFDIQSLFTNFPLDERTDICVDVVYNKCKNVKGMLKPHFKQLRTLSVKSSFLFLVVLIINRLMVQRWALL